MAGHDPSVGIAENYRRFGHHAAGRSPAYGVLAEQVATDEEILAFLDTLPVAKRQPNLLFAAACRLLGQPADIHTLRELISHRAQELATVMHSRRTQTNEAARCATLLPALAGLPEPLALLEVGASAGLTLLPDCYSLGAVWLSNEAPGVVAGHIELPQATPEDAFLLVRDGHELLAATDSHGTWITWSA